MSRKFTFVARSGESVTVTSRRVKASSLVSGAYLLPGRTDASMPLLVATSAEGPLEYGTVWSVLGASIDRPAGPLYFASRTQARLGTKHTKAEADAALVAMSPDQYVYVVADQDVVGTHPGSVYCNGGDHGGRHLKPVFGNASRNAWCNGKGAEYKARAAALAADTTDEDEASVPTPRDITLARAARQIAAVRQDKRAVQAILAKVRMTDAERQQVAAMVRGQVA